MAKMHTILAFILTVLNIISLTSILYLSFMKLKNKNDLTMVIIVAIASYFFDAVLISSFCLTENECCESCCPAEKCCLCFEEKKNQKNEDEKAKGCCTKFCDIFKDCCFIPISSGIRKIGKQGSRYCSLIFLSAAHIGMIILCFYSVKGTSEEKRWNTNVIIAICFIVSFANLFGIFAPCFDCCEKLRYQQPKNTKKTISNEKDDMFTYDTNNTNQNDIIEVNNDKEPLLEKNNSQENRNDNNNSNTMDKSNNSENNINKEEIHNDDKGGNKFAKFLGIKREE